MVQYLDSDLGTYNEFVLALTATLGDRMGTLIRQLPVNQAFTLEAGRSIWGFPKFMTEQHDHGLAPRRDDRPAGRRGRRPDPGPAPRPRLGAGAGPHHRARHLVVHRRRAAPHAVHVADERHPGPARRRHAPDHAAATPWPTTSAPSPSATPSRTMHVQRLSATFHAAVAEPT